MEKCYCIRCREEMFFDGVTCPKCGGLLVPISEPDDMDEDELEEYEEEKYKSQFLRYSSKSVIIKISLTDGSCVSCDCKDQYVGFQLRYENKTIKDLYDDLISEFWGHTEGFEDFLDQVLAIKDINRVESVSYVCSEYARLEDLGEPDEWEEIRDIWEEEYDAVEWDDENKTITGINTYVFKYKNGTKVHE